jgi:hypothetical protein
MSRDSKRMPSSAASASRINSSTVAVPCTPIRSSLIDAG